MMTEDQLEGIAENFDKRRVVFGADEIKSCVVVFEMDGEKYAMAYDAVRYGEEWMLYWFGGVAGDMVRAHAISKGLMSFDFLENALETELEDLILPIG